MKKWINIDIPKFDFRFIKYYGFTILLAINLFAQFSFVSLRIAKSADNNAIINAMDDDAGNAIAITPISYIFCNNGFTAYGNLYFKIANFLNLFDPTAAHQSNANHNEKETSTHFALMLTSLIFLFLLTFLISTIITNVTEYRIVSMLILNSILFTDFNWLYLIFKAHPDILLSFLIAAAFHFTIIYSQTRKLQYYWFTVVFWSLALATKIITILFLPGLIILFLPNLNLKQIKQIFMFYLFIFICYLAVGFPQNFTFLKLFNFIMKQKELSKPATMESIVEWSHLLLSQAGFAILGIVILRILFYEKERNESFSKTAIKLSPIFLVYFMYLYSKNILSPHDYYTLPLAAIIMVFVAYLIHPLAEKINLKFSNKAHLNKIYKICLAYFIYALITFLIPNSFQTVIAYEFRDRALAKGIYEKVVPYQSQSNNIVFVDPYVPIDLSYRNTHKLWGITLEVLKKDTVNVMVLNPAYYSAFLKTEPSAYIKADRPDWKTYQNFYRIIATQDSFIDLNGKKWKRVYNNKWEIWTIIE